MTENQRAELRQVGFATLYHPAAVRAATELLELAPTTPDHSVARWLGRVGGSSGWVLATQVPSLDGVQERAAEHGVRIAVQTQAMGHDIVQLHSLDVGVLLELDEFLPRSGWFWDDLPAAKAAHARRSAKADDIVDVDVAVGHPAAVAATWAAIIGFESPVQTADGAEIAFTRRTTRFVPPTAGRIGIVALDVHATDRTNVAGQQGHLCNTLIRFV
jgi:hypothetical protein